MFDHVMCDVQSSILLDFFMETSVILSMYTVFFRTPKGNLAEKKPMKTA